MADKIKLLELDIDTDSIIAKSIQLKKDLDEVRASVGELKKAGDTSSESFITQSAQMAKLSTEYNLNQKQLTNLVTSSGTLLTASEKANAILGIEANTVTEAANQNKELLKIRNEINVKTPEGVIAVQKLNEKMDQNSKFIKENVSEQEKQKIGIGGYTEAINNSAIGTKIWGSKLNDLKSVHEGLKNTITGAKDELKKHADTIRDFTKGTEGMTVAQKASTVATTLGSGAMNIFKVALASTGIGLLVIALAALIGYFTQTREGIGQINTVIQPLKAIFEALYGVVLNLGRSLFETFSHPKKAMTDLVEFVETNLINRFKAFGVILEGIINLDFKKVVNGALQAGTGVENMTDKIGNAAKKTGDFLEENAKKGSRIKELNAQITNEQMKYNAAQAEFTAEIEKQQLISKDTSKSFAERGKAAKEIIALTQENANAEAHILELSKEKLKIEHELKGAKNLTKEEQFEEIEAEEKIKQAKRKGTESEIEQSRILGGMKKEERKQREDAHKAELDRQQKEIDKAIEKTKQEIDLFITEQGFRKKSLQEEMIFERQLVEEKQILLKQELDNKRITEIQYQDEKLKLTNEYGQKLAEMLSQNAHDELDEFLRNNQSKIDNDKYLTDEIVSNEIDRLNRVSEEKASAATRDFELGIINEREYKKAIQDIDDEFDSNKKALEETKANEDQIKAATDAQNKLVELELNGEDELKVLHLKLDKETAAELAATKKTGTDTEIIEANSAKKKAKIDKDYYDGKLAIGSQIFGQLSNLLGKETAAGKAAAIAQATIDTYLGATKAYQSLSGIPIVGPVLGAIAAGVVVAAGVANVSKISSTDTSVKLKDGAVDIDGAGTETSDSIPAMLSKGESVINAKSTAAFKPLLQAINDGNGYNYLSSQSQTPNIYSNSQSNSSVSSIDYDLLASKIGAHVGNANLNLPAPKLALEDFHRENNSYTNLLAGANH